MLTITASARDKVVGLLQENAAEEGLALRIFVSGGGCSGLQYGMALDPNQQEGDHVIEAEGFKVLVDADSALYLEGAEVDYVDGIMSSGFSINNPNAVQSCSCGQSFKTEEEGGTPRYCH